MRFGLVYTKIDKMINSLKLWNESELKNKNFIQSILNS